MKAISYLIFFLQIAMLTAATTRWTEEDRNLESQQIALWRAKVSASSTWTDEGKLTEFTLGLKSMSYRSEMDGHDPEIDIIYKQIQEVVVSIPDHAKYFTDPIEESYGLNAKRVRLFESQPEWKAAGENAKLTDEGSLGMFNLISGMWGDCGEICSKNLRMLGHIPSTESVRALGRYLRERDEPDIEIHPPYTGELAVESLTELISDGPMQTELVSVDDVPKWQQWFDEVKAGKRTFRFVGSDEIYTLDGPADAATLKRIKEEKMTSQRPDRTKKHFTPSDAPAGTNQKGTVFHGGLLAAILLCLAALAFLLKRRNVA